MIDLERCLRCLSDEWMRKRVGAGRDICVIQCCECGWNVSGRTFEEAISIWNGFKVWSLVYALADVHVKTIAQSAKE